MDRPTCEMGPSQRLGSNTDDDFVCDKHLLIVASAPNKSRYGVDGVGSDGFAKGPKRLWLT